MRAHIISSDEVNCTHLFVYYQDERETIVLKTQNEKTIKKYGEAFRMYEKQPKKMLIMNILEILKRYTDENHRLSQKDIADILKREYDMVADRKAIRRNINDLMDFGYNIEYSETIRMMPVKDDKGKDVIDKKNGKKVMEENYIWSDFYLVRDFTDSELRLLIDGLLFSRHIPYSQCKSLVEKLEGLSNIYFKSRIGYISKLPDDKSDNAQLFYNIEMLDEAISKKRKVTFKYLDFGTDKKQHVKKQKDGSDRVYLVSPYQMAAREGKYYLICNYDKYNDVSNYRLDRITDIQMTDERAKPFSKLEWSDRQNLNLSEYMKKHPYMYASEDLRVTFRITLPMISDIIDMFGTEVKFSDKDDTGVTVTTVTNERSMLQFAKNFAPDVEVLKPVKLRNKIKEELKAALECYET